MKVSLFLCSSLLLAIAVVVSVFTLKSTTTFAAVPPGAGDLTGAAWSSNIGWIDFGNRAGVSHGVTMAPTGTTRNLSGYGWSSNIGWVTFNNTTCPTGYSGNCQPRVEWGTAGGTAVKFMGFARACSVDASNCTGNFGLKPESTLGGWDGFISLGDSKSTDAVGYGARLDTKTGVSSGYAWGSEVVGWLNFAGVKVVVPLDPVCPDGSKPPCAGDPPACPANPDYLTDPTCFCDANPSDARCKTIDPTCPTNPTPGSTCFCDANPSDASCVTPTGICKNIPVAVQQTLNITETSLPPHYRKTADGKCLCTAGYIMNAQFVCTKPIYTER